MRMSGWSSDGCSSDLIAVFGRRENKERLDDMLMKMGLDAATRLVFLPDLEDRDLAALYCRSIVQLYLSQAEGFGLPPMEAMASGCPSIMLRPEERRGGKGWVRTV